jgi:raffinose/stachyose/melibiose transport system permease protein
MADENKNIEQPVDDMDAMVADLKKLKIESEVTNEDAKRLKEKQLSASKRARKSLSIVLAIISVVYVLPVVIVLMNSFKVNTYVKTATFKLPTGDMFAKMGNYVKGMTYGNYPFYKAILYSVLITIFSTFLILLCTTMAAWYVSRVDDIICKIIYFLFIFSMVVPFQMVMFTLSKTADTLSLNTPWTIPIVYLGFGAGLASFMFTGFVKGIPLEIEEAAAMDGCGPIRTFFQVVLPMLRPTIISVAILEIMWIWNDYLLPHLTLDNELYRTIPIQIQYLQGSYGTIDLGAMMALITFSIIPVIVFYLSCQKYIIKGVAAGAVKG